MRSLVRNGVTIPSPYFFAPINTGYAVEGGPDSRLIRFHEERSGKSIGISYVGNVAIDRRYRSNDHTLYLDPARAAWSVLAETIRNQGSVAGIQIACKLSSSKPPAKWRNNDLSSYIDRTRREILDLSRGEIEDICDNFVQSAICAYNVGFQVIQVHAAHGYFLSQLLVPELNRRNDVFSAENVEALRRIICGIRNREPRIVIDVRLSLWDGLIGVELERSRRAQQIRQIVSYGPDVVSLSAGQYEVDRFMIYPTGAAGHAVYFKPSAKLAIDFPDTLWNVAGNIVNLRQIKRLSPVNLTFGVGRPLIADPSFVSNTWSGGAITACVRAGHCHYFTRNRTSLSCKVNPSI